MWNWIPAPLCGKKGWNTPHCMAFDARDRKYHLNLPVYTFLIEHPKGLVLMDTGWGTDVRSNPEKAIGLTYKIAHPYLPQGSAVAEQLSERNIVPSDLSCVVMSHLHTDHAGGLSSLKDAQKTLVTKQEYDFTENNRAYCPQMWQDVNLVFVPFQKDEDSAWNLSYDLFGDGTIRLVFLPGHTAGMMGILIQNNRKRLLLTGDCGYFRRCWEQDILPGVVRDPNEMLKSFAWIRKQYQSDDCIDCISCHELDLNAKEYTL